jgi:signal transduction histidine kinase
MSGQLLLDGSALAISLLNVVLMTWLGLTVLFNAERRDWGVFLSAGGLLTGAAFFISHSIVLSQGASALVMRFRFWWLAGWLPLIAAPYAWYLLMAWYSGYWDPRRRDLEAGQPGFRRRHRPWLWVSGLYAAGLVGLLLLANPLPSVSGDVTIQVERLPLLAGVPLMILAYPPFILICIGLSLQALLRPAPSRRMLGDMARRRARPWLVGVAGVLLLISLLVGAIFFWLIQTGRNITTISELFFSLSTPLSILDLALTSLLLVVVLLLGQAIVSYEIFTGKTLPRRGFLRQWRNVALLGAAFSLLAAYGIVAETPAIYPALASLLLVAGSYALFNWRSYGERQENIRSMRPFTASQRLLDNFLTPLVQRPDLELASSFQTLCRDLMGAKKASLLPLGSLAALGVPALHYPQTGRIETGDGARLATHFSSPVTNGLPLDPEIENGFIWAAPLWSERGLIGLLLLGEKQDGSVYAQEEIEIIRASAERLADILASAEIARRLVALQRQRMAESSLLDRRARRTLHDEILPRLHTALLQLGSLPPAQVQESLDTLSQVHRQISDLLRDLPKAAPPELERLGLIGALQRVTSQELANNFDDVTWQVDPHAEQRARNLPGIPAEVLYYAAREAIRNAARHARRTSGDAQGLHLTAVVDWAEGLQIQIEDNGVGMPLPASATPGNGQGLALHSTMMAIIHGSLALESAPGQYTRVKLWLPEAALETWATERSV